MQPWALDDSVKELQRRLKLKSLGQLNSALSLSLSSSAATTSVSVANRPAAASAAAAAAAAAAPFLPTWQLQQLPQERLTAFQRAVRHHCKRHATCYTSHVTKHTSYVTRHSSQVVEDIEVKKFSNGVAGGGGEEDDANREDGGEVIEGRIARATFKVLQVSRHEHFTLYPILKTWNCNHNLSTLHLKSSLAALLDLGGRNSCDALQ